MVTEKVAKTSQDNEHFIKKSFSHYLFPSILSILGGNISLLVDNCIAGAVLGEQSLATMGIVNPIFNSITAFGLLICGGSSVLASVNIGQGNNQQKKQCFTLAVYMLLAVAAVLTVVGLILLDPIINILGATEELAPMAKEYSEIMILSSVALMGIYFPLNFFRIEGKAKISMIMFFIMAALDIVFDLVFVLVFHWGMRGLALATSLSSVVAVVSVIPALLSPKMGYGLTRVTKPLKQICAILKTGSPLALNNLYTVVRVRILNALLLSCGGSLALAAYGCANSVNNLGMAVVSGVAQTVGPIVGVLYGERDKAGIQNTVLRAVKLGSIATVILWLLSIAFNNQLAILFGMTSTEQAQTAGSAIAILNFNLIASLVENIFIYFYMTTGHSGLSNLLTVLKALIWNTFMAFVGAGLYGFIGLMVGLAVSDVICAIFVFAYASIKKQQGNYDSVLLLSSHLFDYGEYLSRTIPPVSESISAVAEQAGSFCMEHGLSPKQAMTVNLGIEEIMVLMTQYAITSSNQCLEFRLFLSDYETVLRIRCDGKWFNPLNDQLNDEMDNLGVKMLMKMATDISYSTNLGMNNIKIIIKR